MRIAVRPPPNLVPFAQLVVEWFDGPASKTLYVDEGFVICGPRLGLFLDPDPRNAAFVFGEFERRYFVEERKLHSTCFQYLVDRGEDGLAHSDKGNRHRNRKSEFNRQVNQTGFDFRSFRRFLATP